MKKAVIGLCGVIAGCGGLALAADPDVASREAWRVQVAGTNATTTTTLYTASKAGAMLVGKDDGAVVALGGAVKAGGAASVPGLGRAVVGTNGLVVAGLSPAGYVMAAQVREINHQQGVEDDVAFLGDVDVWRGGPLGEIVTQAMLARRRGDEEAYQALLARYWVEYGAAMDRRRVLGKTGTQRSVPGR